MRFVRARSGTDDMFIPCIGHHQLTRFLGSNLRCSYIKFRLQRMSRHRLHQHQHQLQHPRSPCLPTHLSLQHLSTRLLRHQHHQHHQRRGGRHSSAPSGIICASILKYGRVSHCYASWHAEPPCIGGSDINLSWCRGRDVYITHLRSAHHLGAFAGPDVLRSALLVVLGTSDRACCTARSHVCSRSDISRRYDYREVIGCYV